MPLFATFWIDLTLQGVFTKPKVKPVYSSSLVNVKSPNVCEVAAVSTGTVVLIPVKTIGACHSTAAAILSATIAYFSPFSQNNNAAGMLGILVQATCFVLGFNELLQISLMFFIF
ncbi:MAG TPA: hypothetical protein PLK02_07100 [Paludibacteraceae bacterium]|nr:hypothetical protein [Paludibacteraceae bacterium]